MSFMDIFKKSFIEGFTNASLDTWTIVIAICISAVIGFYIFLIYKHTTRKTFYSRNFNISLVALATITTAIILSIQVSIVVSLGMVGALSIVRFRTAIKDPLDLVFLFWSIGTGIVCGAGLAEIAIVLAIIVTIIVFALQKIPVLRAPMILIVNAESDAVESQITDILNEKAPHFKIKSRNIADSKYNVLVEIRTSKSAEIVHDVADISGVTYVSVMDHDGESVA